MLGLGPNAQKLAKKVSAEKYWLNENIIKDFNTCFNSLAIRLQSYDLKHLIPGNGVTELQGWHEWLL